MDPAVIVYIVRALVQLGVSVEQYKTALENPDMSDEELAAHLIANSEKIRKLRDIRHRHPDDN